MAPAIPNNAPTAPTTPSAVDIPADNPVAPAVDDAADPAAPAPAILINLKD